MLLAAVPLIILLAAGFSTADNTRTLVRLVRYIVAAELVVIVLAAAVGATYEYRNRAREAKLYKPPGRLIDIGGYRLHLYCTGSGSPTIVLDFGLDGSYLDWHRVQPEIARFTRVCSYDRGGYGWSDASPRARVPSEMVQELRTALESAGEKAPYVLVGHSFGGLDALMFAHQYPSEVAAVVLVDSMHPEQRISFSWRKKFWLRMMEWTTPFGLPRWRKWCGNGPAEISGIKTAIECRSHIYATNYAQFEDLPAAAAELRELSTLKNIPLVVISRDPRPVAPSPQAEQTWQLLQAKLLKFAENSRQITAEGSGHSIPTQRPDVIVKAIRELVGK